MTQEDIHEEEKRNGIERWVFIGIEKVNRRNDGSYDYYHKERLFSYDLPREVYEPRKWVITWRVAKLQCQFPKSIIQTYHTFYDKKTNIKLWNGPLNKLIAAKRMVTTINNKLSEAKKAYIPTLYDPTIESTEEWNKALTKLKRYQQKVISLNIEIDQLKRDALPIPEQAAKGS